LESSVRDVNPGKASNFDSENPGKPFLSSLIEGIRALHAEIEPQIFHIIF